MLAVAPKGNVNMNNDKPITKIQLSKDWVLPPRPKPGRKPCDDVPSSKRKAQNRAAQRAFRERRANRVTELEDKIMEMERQFAIREGTLNNQLQALQKENNILRNRIEELEKTGGNKDNSLIEKLNSFTPMAPVPLSKKRSNASASASGSVSASSSVSPLEIDFTNIFTQPLKKMKKLPSTTTTLIDESRTSFSIPFESCGFCSDDTPCVCRELDNDAKSKAKAEEIERKERELIAELTRSSSNNSSTNNNNSLPTCTGDPGTCGACQADPLASKFCETVVSKTSRSSSIISTTPSQTRLPSIAELELGKYVPIADAYRTIKNHVDLQRIGIEPIAASLHTRGRLVGVDSVVSCLRELDRSFAGGDGSR